MDIDLCLCLGTFHHYQKIHKPGFNGQKRAKFLNPSQVQIFKPNLKISWKLFGAFPQFFSQRHAQQLQRF